MEQKPCYPSQLTFTQLLFYIMGMRGQNLGLPLLYALLSPPSLTRIPGPRTPKFVYFTLPVLHSRSPIHNIWTLIPTTTNNSLGCECCVSLLQCPSDCRVQRVPFPHHPSLPSLSPQVLHTIACLQKLHSDPNSRISSKLALSAFCSLFSHSENHVAVFCTLSDNCPQAVSHNPVMSLHLDYEQLLATSCVLFCLLPQNPIKKTPMKTLCGVSVFSPQASCVSQIPLSPSVSDLS